MGNLTVLPPSKEAVSPSNPILYVIMKRSAISDNSRYNILSNELVRRLGNMNKEGTSHEEKERRGME